jgi:hypothetical protein
MRYVGKYTAKSGQLDNLLDEMIYRIDKMADTVFPPTSKQAIRHLLLASCVHKTFISKHELAYKVMDLPLVMK